MDITKLTELEYCFIFHNVRTALSDSYAREAWKNGSVLCGRINGQYAGFMCIARETASLMVSYACTLPELRRRGVFTGFLKYLTEHSPLPVRLNIPAEHAFYNVIVKTCTSMGFQKRESIRVFTCKREDDAVWQDFMQKKGTGLCATLKRQGYAAVPFADADESLLEQLRSSDRSDYGNIFHLTEYMDNPARKMSWDMSFAAVRDNVLQAYTLVTRKNADNVIFEQISVSANEQGSGVILLPFVCAMDQFYKKGCRTASYAMYGSNVHANAFRKRILAIFPATESISENYCFVPAIAGQIH